MKSYNEDNIIYSKPKTFTNNIKILNKKNFLSSNDYYNKNINEKLYINQNDTCIICQDNFSSISNSWICDCSHVFHKSCLCKLIFFTNNKQIKCPLCRKNITMEFCLFTYGIFIHYVNIIENRKIDYIGICDIIEMNILKNNINDIFSLLDCPKCNAIIRINNRYKCDYCNAFCYDYHKYNKYIHNIIKNDKISYDKND